MAIAANAGTNRTVYDFSGSGGYVQFNGSLSTPGTGQIESYVWRDSAGAVVAEGVRGIGQIPVGSNIITLTITDTAGATATDTTLITVNSIGAIPTTTYQETLYAIQNIEPNNDPQYLPIWYRLNDRVLPTVNNHFFTDKAWGEYLGGCSLNSVTGPNDGESVVTLDGVDGRINLFCPLTYWLFNELDTFTIGFWAKTSSWSDSTEAYIFNLENPDSGSYIRIIKSASANTLTFAHDFQISGATTDTKTISTTDWFHVTIRKSGTDLEWYVDGSSEGSVVVGDPTENMIDPTKFVLGADSATSPTKPFTGSLADFTLFTVSLTPGEITSLATSTALSGNEPTADASGSDTDTVVGDFIELRSAASTTPSGSIVRREWWNGSEIVGEGLIAYADLPAGTHELTLIVSNDTWYTDELNYIVHIEPVPGLATLLNTYATTDAYLPFTKDHPVAHYETGSTPELIYSVRTKLGAIRSGLREVIIPTIEPGNWQFTGVGFLYEHPVTVYRYKMYVGDRIQTPLTETISSGSHLFVQFKAPEYGYEVGLVSDTSRDLLEYAYNLELRLINQDTKEEIVAAFLGLHNSANLSIDQYWMYKFEPLKEDWVNPILKVTLQTLSHNDRILGTDFYLYLGTVGTGYIIPEETGLNGSLSCVLIDDTFSAVPGGISTTSYDITNFQNDVEVDFQFTGAYLQEFSEYCIVFVITNIEGQETFWDLSSGKFIGLALNSVGGGAGNARLLLSSTELDSTYSDYNIEIEVSGLTSGFDPVYMEWLSILEAGRWDCNRDALYSGYQFLNSMLDFLTWIETEYAPPLLKTQPNFPSLADWQLEDSSIQQDQPLQWYNTQKSRYDGSFKYLDNNLLQLPGFALGGINREEKDETIAASSTNIVWSMMLDDPSAMTVQVSEYNGGASTYFTANPVKVLGPQKRFIEVVMKIEIDLTDVDLDGNTELYLWPLICVPQTYLLEMPGTMNNINQVYNGSWVPLTRHPIYRSYNPNDDQDSPVYVAFALDFPLYESHPYVFKAEDISNISAGQYNGGQILLATYFYSNDAISYTYQYTTREIFVND